jgi:hypothetical protein
MILLTVLPYSTVSSVFIRYHTMLVFVSSFINTFSAFVKSIKCYCPSVFRGLVFRRLPAITFFSLRISLQLNVFKDASVIRFIDLRDILSLLHLCQ